MSMIIKMDAIKTKEHLRKSIPYIFNERKTDGLCFSNAGVTPDLGYIFFDKAASSYARYQRRLSF